MRQMKTSIPFQEDACHCCRLSALDSTACQNTLKKDKGGTNHKSIPTNSTAELKPAFISQLTSERKESGKDNIQDATLH